LITSEVFALNYSRERKTVSTESIPKEKTTEDTEDTEFLNENLFFSVVSASLWVKFLILEMAHMTSMYLRKRKPQRTQRSRQTHEHKIQREETTNHTKNTNKSTKLSLFFVLVRVVRGKISFHAFVVTPQSRERA
jgi:hypothetical protein